MAKKREWPFLERDRKKYCSYEKPTFGCQGCIDAMLLRAMMDFYADPKNEIPRCGECGSKMRLYDADTRSGKLFFACQRIDSMGDPFCGDEAKFEKVIKVI